MSLLFGKSQEDDNFKDLILKSNEKLQLHMDCMNALGEVVGVEDVDDMGGVVSLIFDYRFLRWFNLNST